MKFLHVCKVCGFKNGFWSVMSGHMIENHVDSIPYEGHYEPITPHKSDINRYTPHRRTTQE